MVSTVRKARVVEWWEKMVKRIFKHQAEQNLLHCQVSFTGSIPFTRVFLKPAGYLQTPSVGFYLVHALWGGTRLQVRDKRRLLQVRWASKSTDNPIVQGNGRSKPWPLSMRRYPTPHR